MPLIMARRRQRGGRVRHQCTTRPLWANVKPVKTPIANSGIKAFVLPLDREEQRAGKDGERPDAVGEDLPVTPQREQVRQVVVPREKARQHRKPAERGVGGEGEDHRDRERDDVVGPVPADGDRP